jgi:hypothetical protein
MYNLIMYINLISKCQAVTKTGVPRFKLETDRGGTKWFTKVIKEEKSTDWKDEIVSFVLLVFLREKR